MTLSPKPKIVVIGAGAVGSLIGGLLAAAGEDVTLIARQAHAQAIRAKGLRIEGILGELAVSVKAAEVLDFSLAAWQADPLHATTVRRGWPAVGPSSSPFPLRERGDRPLTPRTRQG
jgi:2-polyprenyl-6-methoxyphenol hydroxylase-like FAD-dependent oxidoreductase